MSPRKAATASLVAIAAAALAFHSAEPVGAQGVPATKHVFLIVMENRSYGEIIGNPSAPYINSLLGPGAQATQYYAVTHPSLPNYLALTGGTTFGISSDCTTCWLPYPSIADNVETAGETWRAYEESMPSACFVGDSYPYVQKHDPFIYYNDIRTNAARCQQHVVPYSQLATDLQSTASTPSFSFITPNACSDMHDCSIATGDAWLQQNVPQILQSWAFTTQPSVLALTWDEDDFTTVNQVPLILVGSGVPAGYASALTYNHYSLLHAIEEMLGLPALGTYDGQAAPLSDLFSASPCTAASVASSLASPQPVGAQVVLTASSSSCPSPRYAFWIQSPAGAWTLAQGFGGPVFNWDTTGLAPGAYTIHVWATQKGDGYDSIGSATFILTGCASASLVPAATTQPAGATLTFTASSTGCAAPRYAFWVQYPDLSWHFVQGFSGGSTFNWNTAGLAPGAYTVHVWANTSGNGYDAVGSASATLTGCTAASLSPSSVSVQAGSTVSFTAASTGCLNPRYAFWVQYPDGSWHFAQNFGGPSFAWGTAGLATGSYTVHVWANAQGNGYDVIGSASVALTGCTSASLSPTSGSVPAGTTVAFTASSSGCSNPRYAFWVQYPDGSWHFLQDFGGPSFSWATSGLPAGVYTIHVWVNTQGNGYDTIGSATYSLT